MRRGVCDGVACAAFIALAQLGDLPLVCGRAVLGHSLGGVVRGRTSPPRLSGTKQELGAMGRPHGLGASFLLLVSRPASAWAKWNSTSSRFSNEVRGDPRGAAQRGADVRKDGLGRWRRDTVTWNGAVLVGYAVLAMARCSSPSPGPEAASGGGAWWELGVASS